MGKRDPPSPNENIAPREANMNGATPVKRARMTEIAKIAVAGRVASVRLQNFMCHSNLQIDFKTGENNCFYIGGPNGSGKSALFAAINLGLGGRGSDNDRGSTVKSYIKDGTSQAKITITLTNEGLNAHPDFDDLISIERTINQSSSTYVLKSIRASSRQEKVISKKKCDVDRIISRFQIHLSNPAFWMSQDRSRSFLANFKPSNVYKLYLESTNLENIRQSYVRFAAALEECDFIVRQKSGELAVEQRKLKRMQEQRELQEKVDADRALVASYKWKLMFCKIRDLEDKIELTQEKQRAQKTLHDATKNEYNENRVARAKVEKKAQELNDDVHLHQVEIEECRNLYEEHNRKVMELEERRKDLETSRKRKRHEIMVIKESIQKAQAEAKVIMEKQGNDQLTRKLAEIRNQFDKTSEARETMEMSGELDRLKDRMDLLDLDYKRKEDEKYDAQKETSKLRRWIDQEEETLRRASATRKNAINKFGDKMAEILIEIDRQKSQFQNVPKGPLGKFIRLVDQKWAYPVEECLGGIANNFLCHSQKDADSLRRIFNHIRIPNSDRPTVIVASRNGHAYSNLEEPSEEFHTIYRMIKVTDPNVHNVIIDKTNCEQLILFEKKTEAMEVMGSQYPPRNASKAYTLDGSQAFAGGAHGQYRFYAGRGGRAHGLFGSEQTDVDEKTLRRSIEDAKKDLEKLEKNDLRAAIEAMKEIHVQRTKTRTEIETFERKLNALRNLELKFDRMMKDLTKEVNDASNAEGLDNLNDGILEMEQKIPSLEEEMSEFKRQIVELDNETEPVRKEKEDAGETFKQIQREINGYGNQLNRIQRELATFDDDGDRLKARLDKLKADEGALFHDEARLKTERDAATDQVRIEKMTVEMPPGEEDPPDLSDFPETKEAIKKYEELQKMINRAAMGCDMSITNESVKEFKDRLKRGKYFCRECEKVLDELKQVHDARLKMYPSLKKYTEMKVCDKFQELLEVRGHFIGGLEFDHDKETLNVNVQSSKEKDAMASKRREAGDVVEFDDEYSDDVSDDDDEDDDEDEAPRRKKAKPQKPKKKKKARDLKGLSGGERSFVTAALVMSLWEVMEQPFRMMDEFDVFMDMMNRKLVMDLLVQLATEKFPHNQFIFFTPQGIKELKKVDGLQVFEMNKVRD